MSFSDYLSQQTSGGPASSGGAGGGIKAFATPAETASQPAPSLSDQLWTSLQGAGQSIDSAFNAPGQSTPENSEAVSQAFETEQRHQYNGAELSERPPT